MGQLFSSRKKKSQSPELPPPALPETEQRVYMIRLMAPTVPLGEQHRRERKNNLPGHKNNSS